MIPTSTVAATADRCPYPELQARVLARLHARDVRERQAREWRAAAHADAQRRRADELLERRRRHGRLIRGAVVLAVLGGIAAGVAVVCTWVGHGVDATVATTPATKRSLVTAAAGAWQWGMIVMAIGACVTVLIGIWAFAPRE